MDFNHLFGTIHDVSGIRENGTDIDYFATAHGAAALQVYLSNSHTPSSVGDILSTNYHIFENMVKLSSNQFVTEYGEKASVYPCSDDCDANGIVVMHFWVKLIYEDVGDSADLFLDFHFKQSEKMYNIKFHNVTKTTYDIDRNLIEAPVTIQVDDLNESRENELQIIDVIGPIPRETITYLHVYLEQQSIPGVKMGYVGGTYKFYVGFKAEEDQPSLVNTILHY